MQHEKSPTPLTEKAKAQLTARAKAILRKTDGLRVLKPNTVGYTIALSAVEAALREAPPTTPAAPSSSAPAEPQARPAATVGQKLRLLGYANARALGLFVADGKETRVSLQPVSDNADRPADGEPMFALYTEQSAADILAAARQAADSLPPVTEDSPELRVVQFIERFDEKLVAAGFTLQQRHAIVGALWTNGKPDMSTEPPRQIGMRDITVAILDAVTDDTPEDVFKALSAACGRVRRLLGAVTLTPGAEHMITCPTCEGQQRLGPKDWCQRCDRSGVIPAHAAALSELVANGLKPYAWENGLTGELTKDDNTGFMWELNRYDVKRLYTLPHPDEATNPLGQ